MWKTILPNRRGFTSQKISIGFDGYGPQAGALSQETGYAELRIYLVSWDANNSPNLTNLTEKNISLTTDNFGAFAHFIRSVWNAALLPAVLLLFPPQTAPSVIGRLLPACVLLPSIQTSHAGSAA